MHKPRQRRTLWGGLLLTVSVLHATAQAIEKPTTFLLRPELLKTNKETIRLGHEPLQMARQSLLTMANRVLTQPARSVVEKSKVPPSGDKHDYLSVGPYWWPDPTKPNGLPYVRKDGQVNPERTAIQDAQYLSALCADVRLLAVAYYFSDDEKYAQCAAERLRVWFLNPETRMNPNLNYGQAIPGITDGRGIGLIDTRALAELVDAVQLLNGAKAWPQADRVRLQNWFRQFLSWMLTSPTGQDEADEHNNHGTYYDVQTVAFALFLGDKALARQILEQKTAKRIQSQLKADGSQPHELARTLSWGYSVMNLKGFFALAQLAENVGVDLWNYKTPDGKSLKKAYQWLLPYAEGHKPWTHPQIKPMHREEFLPLKAVAEGKYKTANRPTNLNLTTSNGLFALTQSLF